MVGEYGEQHPDTLAAMGNLAAILWQEGDLAEAYELQRQVVELNRRVHGDSDRATLIAAAALETMERDAAF
jgi:hypothetical protein